MAHCVLPEPVRPVISQPRTKSSIDQERPASWRTGLPLASGPVAALVPVPTGPEVRRFGRHYLVNGWILTARDLELLGLDAG